MASSWTEIYLRFDARIQEAVDERKKWRTKHYTKHYLTKLNKIRGGLNSGRRQGSLKGVTFFRSFKYHQSQGYLVPTVSNTALVYYSGPLVWGDFEIFPIQAYLNLTDPLAKQGAVPSDPRSHNQKIFPFTASIGMISKSPSRKFQ